MVPRAACALFLVLVLMGPGAPATAGTAVDPVQDLAHYVRAQQAADGGFPQPGEAATHRGAFLTPLAIQALSAAGEDPRTLRVGSGPTAMDWLRDHRHLYDPTKSNDWAKQILGIAAGYHDPRDFGGIDYVDQLKLVLGGDAGSQSLLNTKMFGIFALRAGGLPASDATVQDLRDSLLDAQNDDGSWGFRAGTEGDVDLTGAGIAALVAAGAGTDDAPIEDATRWLKDHQVASGGFTLAGDEANLQNTAWAMWGLKSAGEDLASSAWTKSGGDPVTWLESRIRPDGRVLRGDGSVAGLWESIDVLLALRAPQYPVAAYLPMTRFTWDGEAHAGIPLGFHYSQQGKAHEWRFGDGVTRTGSDPSHIFAKKGTYKVELTLWAGDYGKGRIARSVEVGPSAPVAEITVIGTAVGTAPVMLSASGSHDPDGSVTSYRWTFGDGERTGWGSRPKQSHTYDGPGTYTVRLEVRDNDGLEASTELALVVSEPTGQEEGVAAEPEPAIGTDTNATVQNVTDESPAISAPSLPAVLLALTALALGARIATRGPRKA